MLRTSDLDYELPEASIARHPARPRDSARLLVVRAPTGEVLDECHVCDMHKHVAADDLLVLNRTSVLPARFVGRKASTHGACEGLYLSSNPDGTFHALIQGGHMRAGVIVECRVGDAWVQGLELVARAEGAQAGAWAIRPIASLEPLRTNHLALLGHVGLPPIPPYIRAARVHAGERETDAPDREEYQTVYADLSQAGSVAAPTAGLHMTRALMEQLRTSGVTFGEVTLHVGTGTFRTVETEFLEQHAMHSEWCSMPLETIEQVGQCRARGGRVIPIGTTSARTLEGYARLTPDFPASLETDILITPGHRWMWVDGLLTNFHLPRSTLLAMVASLLEREPGCGVRTLLGLYEFAMRRGYRFYSFGDAMLILPSPEAKSR
jgi:S-adenosylmethionine:tRNA ribosyltransferase-isomerase